MSYRSIVNRMGQGQGEDRRCVPADAPARRKKESHRQRRGRQRMQRAHLAIQRCCLHVVALLKQRGGLRQVHHVALGGTAGQQVEGNRAASIGVD